MVNASSFNVGCEDWKAQSVAAAYRQGVTDAALYYGGKVSWLNCPFDLLSDEAQAWRSGVSHGRGVVMDQAVIETGRHLS